MSRPQHTPFNAKAKSSDRGMRSGPVVNIKVGDNVIPVLTSPIDGDPTVDGTDNFGATTSKAGGRFYHAVTANAGSLTKEEVVSAVQTGASAILASGSMAVTASGALVNATAITGLTTATNYELFYVHVDVAGNMSAVVTVALLTL